MGIYSRYDAAHTHPVNRALHALAIVIGWSSLIVVWFHPIIGLLMIPTSFVLAWIGHFIEGNKPEFFNNPLVVFISPRWLVQNFFTRKSQTSARNADGS